MTLQVKPIFNEGGERHVSGILNGNTTNLREWNRAKYDWSFKLWNLMLKNYWVSDEVSLLNDATQFHTLTEQERLAFDKTLSFLNFLDSIQGENLPKLSDYVTAPEVCSLLNIQAYQEEVHAQSYSYILDSVCDAATRDKIYDEWRTDTLMLERNRFIADLYQRFVDEPSDGNFVRSCMANFILESIYFYSSFAFFYNLARNGKMVKTASIIALINRDELTHVVLFQNMLKELQKENPDIFTEDFIAELKHMVMTAVEWEIRWGQRITNNQIAGLTNDLIERYIKYLGNERVRRLGWEPLYPDVVEHPMKWIETYTNLNNKKADFFQSSVVNYQKASDFGLDDL